MTNMPYSTEFLDVAFSALYPELDRSGPMKRNLLLGQLAEDFFLGEIALSKIDHEAFKSALSDHRKFGTLRHVDHKLYLKASDLSDVVHVEMTQQERFYAMALTHFAVSQLGPIPNVELAISNIYTIVASPYDEGFGVTAEVSVDWDGVTASARLSAIFNGDLSIRDIGVYSQDAMGENCLASLDHEAAGLVVQKREELLERFGLQAWSAKMTI